MRSSVKKILAVSVTGVVLGVSGSLQAQTRVRLSTIVPGTENVQLVANGDFQLQGPVTATNTHPFPIGWTRQADMFADPGTNLLQANAGLVARALVSGGAPVCQYKRTLLLDPNTDYTLSAYLWNLGDAANHVTVVIDLNDAPLEPQVTLSYSDSGADQGYFVYRTFNTANTGTEVTVRIFYDALTGTGAAAKYYPAGAQWDNIAITRSADFIAPQASGSGANLRPLVSITSPADGTNVVSSNAPVTLQVAASASDYDGTVSKVEFYAGAAKVGEAAASPFVASWPVPGPGDYQLTAVATDDKGATTVSAPVTVSANVPSLPPIPALEITRSGTDVLVSWPAALSDLSLQSASDLAAPDWEPVTNTSVLADDRWSVTLPMSTEPRYFRLGHDVDPSTLDRKMLMGYQGWFACAGDGSPMNKWVHWFDTGSTPIADHLTVDFWPDISELDPDELFATSMTMPDGSPAKVYSPWKLKTVLRHFKWMKDYNIDGVFLQRFTSELASSSNFQWRNGIAANVRAGAETYGRVFAIMYDVSGQNEATLVTTVTNDWGYLVNTMHITDSPRYIRHNGKPVVCIWGFGFNTRSNNPVEAQTIIDFFKGSGCTVMGGVPTYWRTLRNDAQTNADWTAVYHSLDILSPWLVTRFTTTNSADSFKTSTLIPDLSDCNSNGIGYMPVVWPGFSWTNVNGGTFNQIPRYGGAFYWRQVYNAVSAGCTMLYGAMFDELNEGTSMFKMAPTAAQLPAQGALVPLDIDGYDLPSDWYLRLAGEATKMLRGEIPVQAQMPISP